MALVALKLIVDWPTEIKLDSRLLLWIIFAIYFLSEKIWSIWKVIENTMLHLNQWRHFFLTLCFGEISYLKKLMSNWIQTNFVHCMSLLFIYIPKSCLNECLVILVKIIRNPLNSMDLVIFEPQTNKILLLFNCRKNK